MAVPNFQYFMLPALKAAAEEETYRGDLYKKVVSNENFTEEQKAERVASGRANTIENRIHWACAYLVQAGLLERPKRGFLKITDAGKNLLTQNPKEITVKTLEVYAPFQEFSQRKSKSDSEDKTEFLNDKIVEKTPEDIISDAYSNIEQAARDEILEYIIQSTPTFFEKLILDLFGAMGYGSRGSSSHVGKTGDGGIDGIINEDPLGLEKVYLQAKRYAAENKISVDHIRSFAGSLDERGARKGIFVTTSSFAGPAYEYAERSLKSLVLIDGEELTRLMYEYDIGVRTVQTIKIKKPDIDYFEDL